MAKKGEQLAENYQKQATNTNPQHEIHQTEQTLHHPSKLCTKS